MQRAQIKFSTNNYESKEETVLVSVFWNTIKTEG